MNELMALEEIKECQCTTDIRFGKLGKMCTISDKDCLVSKNIFQVSKSIQSMKPSTCLPTCVEMRIYEVGKDIRSYEEDKDIRVGVQLIQLPYIRYRRRLSSNIMDLVVCVGGIAGLFFGASIINIAELVYIWIIRIYDHRVQN